MTIPWLMNCSHRDEGWCLECVKDLGERYAALREAARPEETPKFCSECGDDAEKPLGHGCANAKCPVLSASSPLGTCGNAAIEKARTGFDESGEVTKEAWEKLRR